ncbi:MAG: phosphate ABC transporter permease PtsA [Candidatus Meridianibacter frigidus]|nr:MAG: phosphate ABC transporter permease PtsA [Candidatus Eremiobacteraeota bacterium]
MTATTPSTATPFVRKDNASQRRLADAVATGLLWTAALGIVLLLAVFIGYLLYLGAHVISWHFLTAPPSEISAGGGIGPEIFNSFYILVLTLIFTVPVATAAGIYLQEYARPGLFNSTVQFCAESLATIPSIVMGLFGLIVFVQVLHWHFTALGGALALTLLNLPALMRVTQEGLASVPQALREGSMALGATKWQTIRRVVLPGSIAPLTTGIILIAGRIIGETAVLIYTAGVSVSPGRSAFNWNPFHPAETLSVHLWYTHSEGLVPDAVDIGNGSALVLLLIVLVFNISARILGRGLSRHFTGK